MKQGEEREDRRAEYAHLYERGDTVGAAAERLTEIIDLLRSERGCPWDRAQTHESIKQCVIEEAYETKDAIDRGDADNLEEELGDLLLQVVLHGRIGAESGVFDFVSIANRVSDKMIRRHPHIFSKEIIKTIDKVIEKWENVKRQEKQTVSHAEILESVPKALPALTRSYKLQAKAAGVGFDRACAEDVFRKIGEEARELLAAHRDDKFGLKSKIGNLLFSIVNAARILEIDPEDALNGSSQKFIDRFRSVEAAVAAAGTAVERLTLEEMDELWERAKPNVLASMDHS
ncbi:MAG: nucleoside triphosphate pyrophosphohydrolase [Clostridiales Family XIII bacterium]|jgi:tetrapyrrole methylase family protein/MazG family protein|nr:nucleoside triphosphate pyrophosphohydrolase [Clostridiales Family XIII bacterium]